MNNLCAKRQACEARFNLVVMLPLTFVVNSITIITQLIKKACIMKEFKAGDFTSGKMSEIFKECYINDTAVINHKQFGVSYLVPEDLIRVQCLLFLQSDPKFVEFQRFAVGDPVLKKGKESQEFSKLPKEDQMHWIEDFFEEEVDTWLEVITIINLHYRLNIK